jgi:hypothetical protein
MRWASLARPDPTACLHGGSRRFISKHGDSYKLIGYLDE